MNKTDEQIKQEWAELDRDNLEQAFFYLRKHEQNIRSYLADTVAALCNIEKKDMFSNTDVSTLSHARWLYWYAYRYMTNESYDKISKNTLHNGHTFTLRTIQNGVNKMSMMIEEEPIWTKRWTIIKHIIKLRDQQEKKVDNTITINIPKHLRDKINIQIKDK